MYAKWWGDAFLPAIIPFVLRIVMFLIVDKLPPSSILNMFDLCSFCLIIGVGNKEIARKCKGITAGQRKNLIKFIDGSLTVVTAALGICYYAEAQNDLTTVHKLTVLTTFFAAITLVFSVFISNYVK